MLGLSKHKPASGTLRVLAALLAYPDHEMRGYLGEMRAILRGEHVLSAERMQEIDALIDSLATAQRGRLRRTVRSRPRHFVAPVRTCAWRFARSRPGDD